MSEKKNSTKQPTISGTNDQVGVVDQKFELSDLPLITFNLDGIEYDLWSSTAVQFQAHVGKFSKVSNVDQSKWDVFERLDFVNALWEFCEAVSFKFPFTIKERVEYSEERSEVKKAVKKAEDNER